MAFDEDIGQFFDTDEFAIPAVFTRAGAPVVTAAVNFNDPSKAVNVYNDTDVEEPVPFLLAPAATLAPVKRKDAVAVNGTDYIVERIHPDGTGMVLIYLAEV